MSFRERPILGLEPNGSSYRAVCPPARDEFEFLVNQSSLLMQQREALGRLERRLAGRRARLRKVARLLRALRDSLTPWLTMLLAWSLLLVGASCVLARWLAVAGPVLEAARR